MIEGTAAALRVAQDSACIYPFSLEPSLIAPLAEVLTAVEIEVLFDRAFRKAPLAPAVVPFPPVTAREAASPGQEPREDRPANLFTLIRRFREGRGACEISGLFRSLPSFHKIVHEVCDALCTPLEALAPSILVLPAHGLVGGDEPHICAHDTILIWVGGGPCVVTERSGYPMTMSAHAGLFLPKGSQIDIGAAEADVYLLRVVVVSRSIADIVLSFVNDVLEKETGAGRPAHGLFAPDREAKGSYRALAGLAAKTAEALAAAKPDQIAASVDASFQVPPPETNPRKLPSWGPESAYRDSNWGLRGFSKRKDDIFIVTFQRSGTTWMQMILYCLLTDGDLKKINHIYEFSPYLFTEYQIAEQERIDRLPSPRVIKSHQPFASIYSEAGKYIYVARDGLDVLVSSFHHQTTVGPGKAPWSVFVDRFLSSENGSWMEHVRDWYLNRGRPNVLFLTYGELSQNLEATIRRIAEFVGVAVDDDRLRSIAKRCSFASMKAEEAKFDHNAGVYWLHRQAGKAGFLRNGLAGEGATALSAAHQSAFQRRVRDCFGDEVPDFSSGKPISECIPI